MKVPFNSCSGKGLQRPWQVQGSRVLVAVVGGSSGLPLRRPRGSPGPPGLRRSGGDAVCNLNLVRTNFCYLGVQLEGADLLYKAGETQCLTQIHTSRLA